jgi:hypothetical protein
MTVTVIVTVIVTVTAGKRERGRESWRVEREGREEAQMGDKKGRACRNRGTASQDASGSPYLRWTSPGLRCIVRSSTRSLESQVDL